MFVVGLTGGIGSGKSTAAEAFASLGVDVIDADQAARDVVVPGSPALALIAEHFGPGCIDERGELRRRELRERIFAEPSERRWLESLLHPLIAELLQSQLLATRSIYALLVSPLLLETTQRELVDRVVVIDIPEQEQISRTLRRDGGEAATIEAIIGAQMSRQERLQQADYVLDNSGSLDELKAAVLDLHERFLSTLE